VKYLQKIFLITFECYSLFIVCMGIAVKNTFAPKGAKMILYIVMPSSIVIITYLSEERQSQGRQLFKFLYNHTINKVIVQILYNRTRKNSKKRVYIKVNTENCYIKLNF